MSREAGRHCKHAATLLLTWVNDSNSCKEVKAVQILLEEHSKSDLIALIKQMLERDPGLEPLLEWPLSMEENKPLDVKVIRRRAFRSRDYYDE